MIRSICVVKTWAEKSEWDPPLDPLGKKSICSQIYGGLNINRYQLLLTEMLDTDFYHREKMQLILSASTG